MHAPLSATIRQRFQATPSGVMAFAAFVVLGLGLGCLLGNEGVRQAKRRAALLTIRKVNSIADELDRAISDRTKALQLLSHMPAGNGEAVASFRRIYPEFSFVGIRPANRPASKGSFQLSTNLPNGVAFVGMLAPGWASALLSEKNDLGIDDDGDSSVLVGSAGPYETAAGSAPVYRSLRGIGKRTATVMRWSDGNKYQTASVRLQGVAASDLHLTVVSGVPLDRLEELGDRGWRNGLLFGLLFGLVPGAMAWFSISRSTRRLRAANEALEERVSERTAELEAAERSFRSIFENAPLGLYQCDSEGRLLRVNAKLASTLGFEGPDEMIAGLGSVQAFGEPSLRARFLGEVCAAGESEATFAAVRRDGERVLLSEHARAIYDAQGQLRLIEGAVHDVTAQRTLEEQLRKVGATDPLTGLLNRRGFEEAVANAEAPLSFIVLDVDRFKDFNDTYGHLAGDHALQRVAGIVSEAVGEVGSVARIGGEEFIVVVPESDSRKARRLAETLRKAVEACDTLETTLTVSGGVASALSPANVSEALAAADRALYLAKQAGRNRITVNTANLA